VPLAKRMQVDGGKDLTMESIIMDVGPARFMDPVEAAECCGNDVTAIKTTLCELVKNPQKFNGKIIQFKAEYVSKFQWARFVDETCSAKLPVGVFHVLDDLKPWQGQYAFTTTAEDSIHPERLNWKPIAPPQRVELQNDENYRTFREYAGKTFRWPDGGSCLDCPLYRINVTATGRFDYFESQAVAVRANSAAEPANYSAGDSNLPLLRLVLESISNVSATPIDAAVYSERKRREITLEEAHDLVTALMEEHANTKLPGFSLEKYADPLPDFIGFQAVSDNPSGSFNLGFYAVDRRTGDVWNGVICKRVKSASLMRLQKRIRIRIGLTESDYRKARRPGPMCE
jgi:hypothetical protein